MQEFKIGFRNFSSNNIFRIQAALQKLDDDFIEDSKDGKKQFISYEEYKNRSKENWKCLMENRNETEKNRAQFYRQRAIIARKIIKYRVKLPPFAKIAIQLVDLEMDRPSTYRIFEMNQQLMDEKVEVMNNYRGLLKSYLLLQKSISSLNRRSPCTEAIGGIACGLTICIIMICVIAYQRKYWY